MKSFTKGLIIFAFIACSINAKAQIGINNSDPDTSAILDIRHDKKGVIFPRIPNSSKLDDVQGMFFYATEDNKFYYYNDTSWQCVNPLNSTSPNNARLNGNLDVQGVVRGYGTTPLGGIIMWSGEHDDIPDGWALCNGEIVNTIQTPDLRGRFVVGFSEGEKDSQDPSYDGLSGLNAAVSTEYNYVGNVGGDTIVSLESVNIPQHNHDDGDLRITASGGHTHGYRKPGGGSDQSKFDAVGAGSSENIYHISATSLSSTHTHSSSSLIGNTGDWGGAWQDAVIEYDYTGSPCQYIISEPNCTDKHPYTNSPVESDDCGNFRPVLFPRTLTANPEFFGNKSECENPVYNPAYGTAKEISAAHFGVDPVSTRPPYYVIAFISKIFK